MFPGDSLRDLPHGNTASADDLLREIARLRARIAPLERELQITRDLLCQVYLEESGLVGKHAVSDRVPAGIIVEAIRFCTWSAREPQIVYGYRVGTQIWSGIPVTSKGFQIGNAHPTSHAV